MLDLLLIPIAVIFLAIVGALFVYGVNFFFLTFLALRNRNRQPKAPPLTEWPRVTVQLPIFNELYVAERLIDAVAALDYPAKLLEIQVLDDSTDETAEVVFHAVQAWRTRGVPIEQIRRADRVGYKAGALANGLARSHGEFLAIFDADFIPTPDFLRRTLPHFQSVRVAFIQTRWGHVNRDYSFFTFLQALAIDAHFMIEQFARCQSGFWFNFNGTAGVWRRAALEDARGWSFDTLTEDLDLSYRAFLRGWQAVYLRDVEVPAELPVSFSAYRRQQHRWARGSFECARKLLPQVWAKPIPLAQKVEATLHLTGYGIHLLLAGLVLVYPLVILLSQRYPGLASLFGIALLFNVTTFAPTVFFVVAQQQLGRRWWLTLPAILFITLLGAGMMMNSVRAALEILSSPTGVFERTPKFGIARKKQDWLRRRYQLRLDPVVVFEIAFALFNVGTAILAVRAGNLILAGYALMFCFGLLFTSGMTIAQSIAVERYHA
jgi:cellulose synthase/poly-beta-1,6-N-acetylglucosamine synthase-like glycosyltransferase